MGLLELSPGASDEEVKRAYRRLARQAHPDTSEKPDAKRLQQLGEARDIALDPVPGQELATRADLELILRQQGALENAFRETEATLSRVVVHHVGKLARERNRRLTISGLGTIVGLLIATVGAMLQSEAVPASQVVLIPIGSMLAFCSLVTGAMALLSKEREERLRIEIEDAAETLSDRGALMGALAELGVDGFFTREDLQESIYYWSETDNEIEVIRFRDRIPLSTIAAKIGPVDFARLLLSKGLESGMIVESEEPGDRDEVQYGYRRA